jgi:peptidoglycan/xylan/chitin deacetylase (PgdA/CDA1 family)
MAHRRKSERESLGDAINRSQLSRPASPVDWRRMMSSPSQSRSVEWPDGHSCCVSLTFDIEQCTNFPYWTCVWDHLKGALDTDAKQHVGKLAAASEAAGVRCQWFSLGSSFEDPDDEYQRALVAAGHAVGNHTYRHVFVKARTWDSLQVTYRNDPSLASGYAAPIDAVRDEIQRTTEVMTDRLGERPRGFRTPGGFTNGLEDAPEVQDLLKEEGFDYVSSHYKFPVTPGKRPSWDEMESAMRWSVANLQPYRHPNGLLELPMMGISDIWAFRYMDMEREEWLKMLELGIDTAAEGGHAFSILMHPQVLASRDPHAATMSRVLERAQQKGAWITTNDALADHLVACGV